MDRVLTRRRWRPAPSARQGPTAYRRLGSESRDLTPTTLEAWVLLALYSNGMGDNSHHTTIHRHYTDMVCLLLAILGGAEGGGRKNGDFSFDDS